MIAGYPLNKNKTFFANSVQKNSRSTSFFYPRHPITQRFGCDDGDALIISHHTLTKFDEGSPGRDIA